MMARNCGTAAAALFAALTIRLPRASSTAFTISIAILTVEAQTGGPGIPKTWEDAALADWATPLAGLNVRPTHISAKEYYSFAVDNLRTYPVYLPGREPKGYWQMLQRVGPKPLIAAETPETEADWIKAGKQVFDEMDFIHLRTLDPKFINEVREPPKAPTRVLADGTLFGMRWVPTEKGVALGFSNCSFCHTLFLSDGRRVPGAPFADDSSTSSRDIPHVAHHFPRANGGGCARGEPAIPDGFRTDWQPALPGLWRAVAE